MGKGRDKKRRKEKSLARRKEREALEQRLVVLEAQKPQEPIVPRRQIIENPLR